MTPDLWGQLKCVEEGRFGMGARLRKGVVEARATQKHRPIMAVQRDDVRSRQEPPESIGMEVLVQCVLQMSVRNSCQ